MWLEVKVAYQFREGGVRHGGYGAQWRQAVVADLKKMEAEPQIHEAGLVLVVFNESDAILAKDLELFEDVLARREVLAGFRQVRTVPILEPQRPPHLHRRGVADGAAMKRGAAVHSSWCSFGGGVIRQERRLPPAAVKCGREVTR